MINIGEIIAQEDLGKYIYGGSTGDVYRVGDTQYAIKIAHRNDDWTRWALDKERDMARALHHCKVSVPKPIGTTSVENPNYKKIVPAFIMEYIDGQNIFQIEPGEFKERVIKLRDKEVSVAKKAGFVPRYENYPGNMIWCPSRERVYLVDFVEWSRI